MLEGSVSTVQQHRLTALSLESSLFEHRYASVLLHVLVNEWVKNTLGSRTTELTVVLQELQVDIKNNKALNSFRKKATIKAAGENERSFGKRIKGSSRVCFELLTAVKFLLPAHTSQQSREIFQQNRKKPPGSFPRLPAALLSLRSGEPNWCYRTSAGARARARPSPALAQGGGGQRRNKLIQAGVS